MILNLLVIFAIPLILSLVITPYVIRFAHRIGAIDQPNERKVHKYPIPRLGGLAIYFSFFASLLISMKFSAGSSMFFSISPHLGGMLVISLTIVLALGIWDDIKSLPPGKKFLGQFLAATIVYFAGFRISTITHPFSTELLNLGILEFPATIIWIVGITNAFNLIDGLDGLATGVAFIVSLTISIITFLKGDFSTSLMALLLAGSVLGFLRYNFNGAKIFLGDSGSLFLGFLLAILSMQSSTKGSAAFSLIVPMLTLGLPIMDTLLSMTRRLLRSIFSVEQKSKSLFRRLFVVFLPDKGHIHHQLLARGFSHGNAVLILYIVSCLFGVGAFAVTMANNISITPILMTIGIATFIGVNQLRYNEMSILRNGILLPLYEWPVAKSSTFQGFLDLGFIVISFSISLLLSARLQATSQFDTKTFTILAVICGIRLFIFYLGGMYKRTVKQFGIGDLLRILKTVTLSVVLSWMIVAFLPKPWNAFNWTLAILDFYFLLSFIIGTRISFHILNYLSRRGGIENGKKKILIYGADEKGILIMQQILNEHSLDYSPVGFIDDDPQLEGKYLNGYPVFGGHWKLQRVLQQNKVSEIIFSKKIEFAEVFNRVRNTARTCGVTLRDFRFTVDQIGFAPEYQSQGQYSIAFNDQPEDHSGVKTTTMGIKEMK